MDREQVERVRRAMEPPWDDVREQRVLGRILDERRAAAPKRRVRAAPLVLVSAVVAAAAVVLLFVLRPASPPAMDATRVATPALPTSPSGEAAAHLTFVDGSVATLEADARVRVDSQSTNRVELSQLGGRVGYEVTHDTSRPFLVHAGKVVVSVLGTKFVVVRSKKQVEVHVTEGLVGVDDGARVREVSPGETLIVPVDDDEASAAPSSSEKPGATTTVPSTTSTGSIAPPVNAASLLAKADDARAKGRTDEAASALQQMLILFPGDPRIPSAAFTLGRLERKRGHAAAAAQAFARCRTAAPAGALAEDALAEEALAWAAAGQKKAAADAASRYLSAHPTGAYAARLRPLVEGAP
jgi:transmembrane sensor